MKLTFQMPIVHGQQHSFETRDECSCESVDDFETEKVSTRAGLEPPTFGFMPNDLTIVLLGPDISYFMFWNTCSGGMDTFVCKVKIWNVNSARQQHSFSTHERMFFWKRQHFGIIHVSTGRRSKMYLTLQGSMIGDLHACHHIYVCVLFSHRDLV